MYKLYLCSTIILTSVAIFCVIEFQVADVIPSKNIINTTSCSNHNNQ